MTTLNFFLAFLVISSVSASQSQTRLTRVESELSAEDLYSRGRDLFTEAATATNPKMRADNLKRAVKYFEDTIYKDSAYFPAYLALLQCYTSMSGFGATGSAELTAKTKTIAAKAISLNGDVPEPHQMLAWSLYQYDWDWGGAEQEFKQTLELNPEFAELWPRYASFLSSQGRTKEAQLEIHRMTRYGSDIGWTNFSLGYIFFWGRQYDSATVYFKKAAGSFPNLWLMHFHLGFAYAQQSQFDNAEQEFRKAVVLSGRNGTAISGLGYNYALAGKRHEALSTLEELEKNWKAPGGGSLVPAYRVAAIYAALGDNQEALEWLRIGLEARSAWMVWVKVDPAFDSLHKDSKFIRMLREIGLWK